MTKVHLIVGLPGSGKTVLAQTLLTPGTVLLDDLNIIYDLVFESFNEMKSVIITDPAACVLPRECIEVKLREWFGSDCEITITAFANDPDACWRNIEGRVDNRVISRKYLYDLSVRYNCDQYDCVVSVYGSL